MCTDTNNTARERGLRQRYVEWLETYAWDWACTLNFRFGIRRKSAGRLWREWIKWLEEIEGNSISWARMVEEGDTSGRLHFHGVVAGIRSTTRLRAECMWESMAGDAEINQYESVGWLWYMLKEMEATEDYDFDLELLPRHRASARLISARRKPSD